MKRYINQNGKINRSPQIPLSSSSEPVEAVSSDLDVVDLLKKSSEILNREIRNLMTESSRGKLNAASARDLVRYIKLLNELKQDLANSLSEMTDEELLKKVEND